VSHDDVRVCDDNHACLRSVSLSGSQRLVSSPLFVEAAADDAMALSASAVLMGDTAADAPAVTASSSSAAFRSLKLDRLTPVRACDRA
jgi:hypothetical protein